MELEFKFHENLGKFTNYVTNLRSNEDINYNKLKKYLKLAQRSIDELISTKKNLS